MKDNDSKRAGLLYGWRRLREDRDIEGFFKDPSGQWNVDRRMSLDAMEGSVLTPRTADLNLIGPDILPVPDFLLDELGLE